MRLLILATLLAAGLFVACSDDDGGSGNSDVAEGLEEVCTQGDDADTDNIKVDSPDDGDRVSSPLTITGEIVAVEQQFWVSAVKGDGEHIIDYPVRSREFVEDELSPFEASVPFTVGEETPICVWVYRESTEEPADTIKIPVTFLPPEDVEADPQ